MADDIINLGAYRERRQREDTPAANLVRIEATGPDTVELDMPGIDSPETWVLNREQSRQIARMLRSAEHKAKLWDVSPCPVCQRKVCNTTHNGQIWQHKYDSKERYKVSGQTRAGRWRLRPLGRAKKIRYVGNRRPSSYRLVSNPPAPCLFEVLDRTKD